MAYVHTAAVPGACARVNAALERAARFGHTHRRSPGIRFRHGPPDGSLGWRGNRAVPSKSLMRELTVQAQRSPAVAHYLRPDLIPRMLWRDRQLIGQLVRRNLSMRYRGSALGMAWSFVLPLVMLAVYTFVFSVVFGSRWNPKVDAAAAQVARAASIPS